MLSIIHRKNLQRHQLTDFNDSNNKYFLIDKTQLHKCFPWSRELTFSD